MTDILSTIASQNGIIEDTNTPNNTQAATTDANTSDENTSKEKKSLLLTLTLPSRFLPRLNAVAIPIQPLSKHKLFLLL